MGTDDDKCFCPRCQVPRVVWFREYGWLYCPTCRAEFTLSQSLKAEIEHAVETVKREAARLPR